MLCTYFILLCTVLHLCCYVNDVHVSPPILLCSYLHDLPSTVSVLLCSYLFCVFPTVVYCVCCLSFPEIFCAVLHQSYLLTLYLCFPPVLRTTLHLHGSLVAKVLSTVPDIHLYSIGFSLCYSLVTNLLFTVHYLWCFALHFIYLLCSH